MIFHFIFLLFSFFNFQFPDSLEANERKLKVSGAIDVYYGYDFNKPLSKDRQFTTQAVRHNEFNINWAYIQLEYLNKNVRGNFALQTGTYAMFNYAEEPALLQLIAQANAGVRIAPNIWLDAGIMPSHIGYEYTLSAENEVYTRSLMAENSPYFSTGVQLSADLSEVLAVSFVVLNGWQNITETNDAKSFGINVNFRPSSKLEMNYSNYYGDEGDEATGRKMRFFNHSYIKYQFVPKFHSVVSFDIGNQELLNTNERRTWQTGMIISQYQFTNKISLACRLEYFHDPNQIIVQTLTPHGFQTSSATLTLNYALAPNALIRLEGRSYNSKDRVFDEGLVSEKENFLLVGSLTVKF